MALRLEMDPTTVNILTDVLLLVLQVIWVRMMVILTELDMKRNVRKGRRVFSFETMGSLSYLTHGLKKFRRLKRKNILSPNEAFRFRLYLGSSIISLLLSISLVLMHILIDYGLDYETVIDPANDTISYGMVGLSDNSEIVNSMGQVDSIEKLKRCIAEERHIEKCRLRIDEEEKIVYEELREGMSFARSLYHAPSVTSLDIIDNLKLDYKCIDRYDHTVKRPDCKIVEEKNATDFEGVFKLNNETCLLQKFFIREVTLDMRAQRTVRRTPVGLENVAPDRALGSADLRMDIDRPVEYASFSSFKDDRQLASLVSVVSPKKFGKVSEDSSYAEVVVNSRVQYTRGEKQTVRILSLSRTKQGSFPDTKFTMKSVREHNVPSPADQPDYMYLTPFDARESNAYNLTLDVLLDGKPCDQFSASWVSRKRQRSTETYRILDGEEERAEFGFEMVEMIVGVDQESTCGKKILRRYRSYIERSIIQEKTALFVALSFEIVCFKQVDGRLSCVYGNSNGKNKLYYNGKNWINNFKPPARKGLVSIGVLNEVSFIRVEVQGGDPGVVSRALRNVEAIFKNYYPELARFSSRASTRGRIFSGRPQPALRDVIFALSTQVKSQTRVVTGYETRSVSLLLDEYIIGLVTVLSIVVVTMLIALVRFVVEYWMYRKQNVSVTIPVTATGWIHSVLASSKNYPKVLGSGYAHTYEFVVNPVREEDGRKVVDGSIQPMEPS
uniref:Uncharacterized protein n=1 Tax=Rhodosorus marinus TaxID=101924 RepID=A0A7S3EDB7_9RHOD|mmetsp:Transcript_24545/g.96932  ORF Transcript_24545/g.96932 Transcript_24545/m.96932 type:complete len:726 (+) Transcript_24545:270-2447(+)